jgi:pimeloyl-ACP methyl ester carboxylesterase
MPEEPIARIDKYTPMNNVLRRVFRKKRFYAFLLLFLGFYAAYSFLDARMTDREFLAWVHEKNPDLQATVGYKAFPDRKIRYLQLGHQHQSTLILFVHGAPSSSAFWRSLLLDSALLANAQLMTIDRPGYGFSGFGKPEVSVKKQAEYIGEILKEKRGEFEQIVLHGSSYGGTVAARTAMDYPELVDGLLLQSASVAPGAKKTYWISYPTSHWLLEWLIPRPIRVANAEKLSHFEQLKAMENLWHRIRSACIILHGTADGLIYPFNAEFAAERLTNAARKELLMIPDRGHDLLFTEPNLLKRSLLKLVRMKLPRQARMEAMAAD